jgi:hypothetical protein
MNGSEKIAAKTHKPVLANGHDRSDVTRVYILPSHDAAFPVFDITWWDLLFTGLS